MTTKWFVKQDNGIQHGVSRRKFICGTAAFVTGGLLLRRLNGSDPTPQAALPKGQELRYKIAVCDWMILQRQKLGAFALAKEIGADGVEVDMGPLGNRETFANQLAQPDVRQRFLSEATRLGIAICSLAMSGFYGQSFAERPTVLRMVQDCIDTMKAMGVTIAFLPLGVHSDPARHPELRPVVVERLKAAACAAEHAGVIIGIETELPASEQIRLLDEIGSPAVKVYYNFANAIQNDRNLIAELRELGAGRICQIHCTNKDGVWLQNDPELDMHKVKETLDAIGWRGWLVVERSRDAKEPRNVKKNYSANVAYLKSVFQQL